MRIRYPGIFSTLDPESGMKKNSDPGTGSATMQAGTDSDKHQTTYTETETTSILSRISCNVAYFHIAYAYHRYPVTLAEIGESKPF
jgi:hypothetical protein